MTMATATPLVLALSIAITGLSVYLVAVPRDPRRLFLIDLGRDLTAADQARARRVLAITAGFVLGGIAGLFVVDNDDFRLTLAILCLLVPVTALVVESIAAARTIERSAPPAIEGEELAEPPPVWDFVSAPLQAANIAIIAAGVAAFAWLLERLPEKVPVHWNLAGEIDRWASPSTHWFLLGIVIFDTLLMWGVIAMIARERWALPATDRERYVELQYRRRLQMARLMEWMIVGINVAFVVMWLLMAAAGLPDQRSLAGVGIVAMLLLMAVAIIGPLIVYLPRMMEVAKGIREIAGTEVLGTHDDGWRWSGFIYYAPDDPAVIVPKKIGIGQTFNLARPAAWVFLAVLVGLPLVLTGLLVVFVD